VVKKVLVLTACNQRRES